MFYAKNFNFSLYSGLWIFHVFSLYWGLWFFHVFPCTGTLFFSNFLLYWGLLFLPVLRTLIFSCFPCIGDLDFLSFFRWETLKFSQLTTKIINEQNVDSTLNLTEKICTCQRILCNWLSITFKNMFVNIKNLLIRWVRPSNRRYSSSYYIRFLHQRWSHVGGYWRINNLLPT